MQSQSWLVHVRWLSAELALHVEGVGGKLWGTGHNGTGKLRQVDDCVPRVRKRCEAATLGQGVEVGLGDRPGDLRNKPERKALVGRGQIKSGR
jgi:hypothetical protein